MFRTYLVCITTCATCIADDGSMVSPRDRIFDALKPIASVTADIRPTTGALPDYALVPMDDYPAERCLGMTFCWRATGVSYEPLVFEEYNLERHGHSVGCLQPLVSGAHFLGSTATLPLTAAFCHDREYELGHVRPGSCAPFVVLFDGKKLGTVACAAGVLLIP